MFINTGSYSFPLLGDTAVQSSTIRDLTNTFGRYSCSKLYYPRSYQYLTTPSLSEKWDVIKIHLNLIDEHMQVRPCTEISLSVGQLYVS